MGARGDEVAGRGEFGGVPGNLALLVLLPLCVYGLYFCVRFNGGAVWPGPDADVRGFLASIVPTKEAATHFAIWIGFQALLQVAVPGRVVRGAPLADGTRLSYRMNGLSSLAITAIAMAILVWKGGFSLARIHDAFGALVSVAVLFSYLLGIALHAYGRIVDRGARRSGSFVRDYFLGTSLNPRIPPVTGFDLKLFCEARPGLIGWMLINASFAWVQYERYGFVSTSMLLVCAFQLLYVVDYFWNEPAILTTIDVKHERFGWMLAFGDLAWVPLTYSLQAFYLIDHVHALPLWAAGLITALDLAGVFIFRATNLQKHRFRSDPEGTRIWGRPAEFIETRVGGKLLVSGFWGWARHFNYVGDLLMAVAWSLPCLFASPLPWFYPVYFAVLLVHRERRDQRLCARKYGADWDRYCERVPWRILPGVY